MGRPATYSYFAYKNEATFLSDPGARTRVFGMEQKVSNVRVKENLMKLYELNSNVIKTYGYGLFEGSFDVDFRLSGSPWWFDLIFGTPTTTGTGPYTYTYAANGVIPKAVTSFAAEIGTALELANVVRKPLGCVLGSVNIASKVGDWVSCKASCLMGKELTPGTSLNGSPPSDSTGFPFTFEHGQFQLPDASSIAEVQSFELTLNPKISYNPGHNTIYPVSPWRADLEITGRFNVTAKDATLLNNVLSRTEGATLTLVFDNGQASTLQKKITMPFVGVGYDEHDTGHSPNEIILEDLPLAMRNVANAGVTVINNISAAP